MPWLGDYKPKDEAAQKWQSVIKNALQRRVDADQLRQPLKELHVQYQSSPTDIADLLLSFRGRNVGADDPLIFHYAELCLRMKYFGASHLLLAVLNTSPFAKRAEAEDTELRSTGLLTCEERMFILLTQLHMTNQIQITALEAHGVIYAVTRWMHEVTEYEMGKQLEGGALHTADAFSYGTYDALASLVITVFSTSNFREVGKQRWWKKRRSTVVSEMENFDSHVLQWMQSQLAGRLHELTNMPPFLELDSKKRPLFNEQQILRSIPELPVVRTRAGLFIWLNACLCALPLTDDMTMLAYLQARYAGENQTLAVDLLLASFDVLTSFLLRKEPTQRVKFVRSFVCNKMPLFLSMLSNFMPPPMAVEAAIQMAFMSISMDALPPLSDGAVQARDKLKLARTEFLQACLLHNLISENAIAGITQEPLPPLSRGKLNKDELVAQCSNNVGRVESLINELESTVGNAGALSACVLETLANLCLSKDTMALKTICSGLIKRLASVDVILQYTQPAVLLLPLCNILNEWVHDQDLAELTPSYEEFAFIVLFIYAVVHRYDLKRSDLGLTDDDSFVAKLLRETSVSRLLSQLTDEESAQLNKWIEGLYGTDEHGESSGISDEVMRQCPPQSFFALVPTLAEQSVLACKSGSLPMKTFKGGLELLVEPFLLPSLVGAISWMIKHLWEDHGDTDIILQILDKVLRLSSSSADAKIMHKIVLGIVADPLNKILQECLRKKDKKEIKSLMELLKPHLASRRTMECTPAEVTEWTATSEGGVAQRIRKTIDDHISWVSNVGPTPPPKYTHKLFAFATKVLGASAVLNIITTTLKEQTSKGNGPLALDICNAIVAAPLPCSYVPIMSMGPPRLQASPAELSVRDAMRLRISDSQSLLQISAKDAEALVRLGRAVEAQLAVNQLPQMPMAIPLQAQATDQIMADLGLADPSVDAAAAGSSIDQAGTNLAADFGDADLNNALGGSMDLTGGTAQDLANVTAGQDGLLPNAQSDIFDLDLGLGQGGSNAGLGTGDGQDMDDIFGGLEMTVGDEDFNFP